jgi:hypothetical protein
MAGTSSSRVPENEPQSSVGDSVPPLESQFEESGAEHDSDVELEMDEVHVVDAVPVNVVDHTERNVNRDIPNVATSLSGEELLGLRKTYDVPDYIELILPAPTDRMYNPPMGSICVTTDALAHGLRFPIPCHIVDFLRGLELNITQINANGMGHLIAWAVFMRRLRVPLTLENLAYMYTVNKSPKHPFYYFNQRPHTTRFGPFTSSLGAVEKWSAKYLYVRFNPSSSLPEGVNGLQFLELPRLWKRGRISLEAYKPVDTPEWFDNFVLSPDGDKWNPYAFVVEPILFLAGLSQADPVRREIDSLGIYIYFFPPLDAIIKSRKSV